MPVGRGEGAETPQIFSVHTTPEKFENATIIGHFGFVFEENSGREKTWLSLRYRFRLCFKMFSVHADVKPAFSNSSGLKGVFKKLRFRDGLVWTVGLTVEIIIL